MKTTILIITLLFSLACLSTAAITQPSTTSYKKAPRISTIGADFAQVIPTPQTLTVCAEVLNVRTGAGTSYTVIDHLFKGETITVQGRTADEWVRIANNQWVNGDYLCEVEP
jgi:uncharacterized protein YgiM (DUF1202 family)